jgi:phage terminase large subunit-like protein
MGGNSYGPQVAAWSASVLGIELMPWQIRALTGQLEHDDTDRLRRRLSLVSCARQNGKSVALQALVGWWLTEMPIIRRQPQTVISSAHSLDLAVALFQQLAPILEAKFGASAKWSYGRNELVMPDGSMWLVRAATNSAGHGRSPSLVVLDEVWSISDEVIDHGLIPAQRAQRSPLCSMWSTAGTEASRAMLRYREQGITAIEQDRHDGPLYFAEWSPPPTADISDPQTWIAANPALGITIELETLVAEAAGPNRAAFQRANLNMWVATSKPWLEPGIWEDAWEDDLDTPPSVLAFDSSQWGDRYVGVVARPLRKSDPTAPSCRLEVAFVASTEAEAWQYVADLAKAGSFTLATTPGLDKRCPQDLARRLVVVGEAEIRRWTKLVGGLIREGRVRHDGSALLAEHISRAVAVVSGNGQALSSPASPGPIEIARCAVWAAALATKPGRSGRPMVFSTAR